MDANETDTVIPAGRYAAGKTKEETLADMKAAGEAFAEAVKNKFDRQGEW